ncbi:MAG: acylneuraminate cytidylyltransferase family protein [Alistipes sp.]|nr:acylneuraminate cytidylyltransferase family protein [Alistipes sp.]MBP3473864.1 acylneuraminate cytidylyltransferase family protein [Alistipes sp.]MBR3793240.1 acylneuraminate cytidylyltransferase family protein [Alistipes sp.]
MRRVAFVPIRLNSQRVEGKNLRELGGRPLMAYLLESLAAARNIDKVYVYCSNPAIVEYLPEGVEWLQRDERLDQNTTLGEEIYDAFTREVEADIYILAHATSPFIRTATIEQAVRSVESGEYDSAFSAERVQTFAWWQGRPLNYSLQHVPRTQDLEPLYVETSAFFVFRAEVWREQHRRIGQRPYMAVTDRIESMDIDDPDDFLLAEAIVTAGLNKK